MQCPVQYIAVYSAVQCRAVQCRTLFLSWPPSAPLPGAGLDLGASVSGAAQNVLIAKLSAVSPPDECTALHFTALHSTAPPPVHMVHSGLDGLVLALAASLPDTTHRLAPALPPRWAVQCSAAPRGAGPARSSWGGAVQFSVMHCTALYSVHCSTELYYSAVHLRQVVRDAEVAGRP
jgi:hypothetical protein